MVDLHVPQSGPAPVHILMYKFTARLALCPQIRVDIRNRIFARESFVRLRQ